MTSLTINRWVLVWVGFMLLFFSCAVFAEPPAFGIYHSHTNPRPLWISFHASPRPMASLTKLMTARLVFASTPDWSRRVTVRAEDVRASSTTVLRAQDTVTLHDLMYLMMVSSDNVAARTLARHTAGTRDAFVERMNHEARALGMTQTHYADPAGLLATNISTIDDLIRLVAAVSLDAHMLPQVFHTQTYTATVVRARRPVHVTVRNTNRFIDETVTLSKTGFTRPAGYCLVEGVTIADHTYTILVMGAPTKEARTHLIELLREWIEQFAPSALAREVSSQQE